MTNNKNKTVFPSLKGRHALVSGGASGIGEALVRALAQQGCLVSFLDIDQTAGDSLAKELKAQGLQAHFNLVDLTDIDRLQAVINERMADW